MTTHHHEETTTMRVPPSPDATTPTDRTPEPVRVVYLPEVITDRAAIRDSDEADEPRVNGDLLRVMAEYAEPAPALDLRSHESLTVAASALRGASSLTDDDETAQWLETLAQQFDDEAANTKPTPELAPGATTMARELDEARHLLRLRSDALARVTREAEALRAKVAAVETVEDSWSGRTLPSSAWPHVHHWLRDLRAALATTGEGE